MIISSRLFLRIQNLLLNLLLQFNCTDLYNQVPKMIESKMLTSAFNKDAEEINKVYILCIARSFIVTGLKTTSSGFQRNVVLVRIRLDARLMVY